MHLHTCAGTAAHTHTHTQAACEGYEEQWDGTPCSERDECDTFLAKVDFHPNVHSFHMDVLENQSYRRTPYLNPCLKKSLIFERCHVNPDKI